MKFSKETKNRQKQQTNKKHWPGSQEPWLLGPMLLSLIDFTSPTGPWFLSVQKHEIGRGDYLLNPLILYDR